MEKGDELMISRVIRFDFPNDERVHDEIDGIHLVLHGRALGIRFNIDNSGYLIENAIETLSASLDQLETTTCLASEVIKGPLLDLIEKKVIRIDLGFVDEEAKPLKSGIVTLGSKVGIRLIFEKGEDFVFWNDGDEGMYSFSLTQAEKLIPLSGVHWAPQANAIKLLQGN